MLLCSRRGSVHPRRRGTAWTSSDGPSPGSKLSRAQQHLAHAKKHQKQQENDAKHWNQDHIPVPCEASWIRLQPLPHSMSQESSFLTLHSTHRQGHGAGKPPAAQTRSKKSHSWLEGDRALLTSRGTSGTDAQLSQPTARPKS